MNSYRQLLSFRKQLEIGTSLDNYLVVHKEQMFADFLLTNSKDQVEIAFTVKCP